MTNILTLVKPLLAGTEVLLTDIAVSCSSLDIEFFVAGATAREVILHHVHGTEIGRRTRDIDIAIFVDTWSTFEKLKSHLNQQGAISVTGNAHRVIWRETEIDIIPFGGVAENKMIAWPSEKAVVMSIDGFVEAFENAVIVRLNNGREIKFCSLPGLALLKLFAWRDRGKENKKDATDLYKIITDYCKVENERIYSSLVNIDALDGDPKRMGANLLGHDIISMLTQDQDSLTLNALRKIDQPRLTDAIISQYQKDTPEEIEQLVDDLWDAILPNNQ